MEFKTPQYAISIDDYLKFEVDGRVRHEYIAGEIFAMTGASRVHNEVAGRLFAAFTRHLLGGPCRTYISDVKLRLKSGMDHIFYYPDIMVTCVKETDPYYVTNPKLVVEVLSPTTEVIDRREKALHYKQIPSLEEYVMIAQDPCEVTILRRDDSWQPSILNSLEAIAEFRSIGLSLPVRDLYGIDAAPG